MQNDWRYFCERAYHRSITLGDLLLSKQGVLADQKVWFPGDIFTKIQQNLQFYRHLPGRVTNPWDHIDPVYPSNSLVDSPNID